MMLLNDANKKVDGSFYQLSSSIFTPSAVQKYTRSEELSGHDDKTVPGTVVSPFCPKDAID